MSKRKPEVDELPPSIEPGMPNSQPDGSTVFNQFMDAAVDESGLKAAQLLSSLPTGSGYYFKLYKYNTGLGRRPLEFKCDIEYLEPIYDLESELQRRITENHWGTGEYVIRTHCMGQRGAQKEPIRLYITDLSQTSKSTSSPNGNGASSQSDTGAAVSTIKAVTEAISPFVADLMQKREQAPAINLGEITKALSDTLVAGVAAAKASAPAAPAGGESMKDLIKEVVILFKQFMPVQKEEMSLIKVMETLQKLNIIPEKRGDSMAEVKNLLGVVNELRDMQPEAGGKTSTTVEVMRTLSPHIGEVLGVAKEGLGLIKARMSGMPLSPPAQAPRINPSGPPEPQDPNLTPHPFFVELKAAIDKNDQNYFPRLVHAIGYWLENGDQYLSAALAGTMSVDWVQGYLVNAGGQYFSQGRVKDYLFNFINWYRGYLTAAAQQPEVKTAAPADLGPSATATDAGGVSPTPPAVSLVQALMAHCSTCNEAYEYDSMEDFNLDDRKCDASNLDGEECGGPIILDKEKGLA